MRTAPAGPSLHGRQPDPQYLRAFPFRLLEPHHLEQAPLAFGLVGACNHAAPPAGVALDPAHGRAWARVREIDFHRPPLQQRGEAVSPVVKVRSHVQPRGWREDADLGETMGR